MKPPDTFRFYRDDGDYREVHISRYDQGLPRGDDKDWTDIHFPWLAAHWGLPAGLTGWDLKFAVLEESGRRGPCRWCGSFHRLSVDPYLCDRCFMLRTVREIRWSARAARARELKRAARDFVGRLPAGRRQRLEGMVFSSPEQAYEEAFDEVIS